MENAVADEADDEVVRGSGGSSGEWSKGWAAVGRAPWREEGDVSWAAAVLFLYCSSLIIGAVSVLL